MYTIYTLNSKQNVTSNLNGNTTWPKVNQTHNCLKFKHMFFLNELLVFVNYVI